MKPVRCSYCEQPIMEAKPGGRGRCLRCLSEHGLPVDATLGALRRHRLEWDDVRARCPSCHRMLDVGERTDGGKCRCCWVSPHRG